MSREAPVRSRREVEIARLFRGSLQKTLDRSSEQGLEYLKGEAERRAGT